MGWSRPSIREALLAAGGGSPRQYRPAIRGPVVSTISLERKQGSYTQLAPCSKDLPAGNAPCFGDSGRGAEQYRRSADAAQ